MAVYLGSPKHCEPITVERPGLKCPAWSRSIAQELLDHSIVMGEKRVATRDGVAFVAQLTHSDRDIWHGYPESWDNIDQGIKNMWKKEGLIQNRDLRTYKTRDMVRNKFGGSL